MGQMHHLVTVAPPRLRRGPERPPAIGGEPRGVRSWRLPPAWWVDVAVVLALVAAMYGVVAAAARGERRLKVGAQPDELRASVGISPEEGQGCCG
jgi:hypothetical protein